MGRPQKHSQDTILDAARELVLAGGARSATLSAIAGASGAPKGSLYHRFPSRDDLLAEVWTRAVRRSQAAFIEATHGLPAIDAAVAAALSIYDFAEREPSDARLLASVRREDLTQDTAGNPARRTALEQINRPLGAAISRLAKRLYGRAHREAIDATICAIVDLPMGAIRRHLMTSSPFPPALRRQLEAAVRAALAETGAT